MLYCDFICDWIPNLHLHNLLDYPWVSSFQFIINLPVYSQGRARNCVGQFQALTGAEVCNGGIAVPSHVLQYPGLEFPVQTHEVFTEQSVRPSENKESV